METINNDTNYTKYKLIVKKWEKNFKLQNHRIPSKFDIKEAPSKVKYAYKKYFQMKSSALENSLDLDTFDTLNDSVFNSPESSFSIDALMDEHSPRNDSLSGLPNDEEFKQLLSNDIINSTPKPRVDPAPQIQKQKSTAKDSLSKKLFQNSKFSLRNPRKSIANKSENTSLCDTRLKTGLIEELEKCEVKSLNNTCDAVLENVLISKINHSLTDTPKSIKPCLNMTMPVNTKENIDTNSLRQYNDGWLKRITGININYDYKPSTPEKFGLKNINICQEQNLPEEIPDYVENSGSEDDFSTDKLQPALKKRKIMGNKIEEEEKVKIKRVSKKKEETKEKKELQVKNTKSRRSKVAIDDDEVPPTISEFIPLGVEEDLVPRCSNALEKSTPSCSKSTQKRLDPEDRLEQKIKSGTLNDNFVKINIEKKVFVRGKKSMNYSKYKKQQNKMKKALHGGMEFPEAGKIACFKCGEFGHMSRYCTAHRGDSLLPLATDEVDDMPTLMDMDKMENTAISIPEKEHGMTVVPTYKASMIPDSFLKLLSNNDTDQDIGPVYTDMNNIDMNEIHEVLQKFGHTTFRHGQEQAIKRILCGYSTLLLLSTGGGKSLCYQLPAYMYRQKYKSITLVISPLVSLMEDQVLSMPEFLKAGCLHTNQPPTQRNKIIQLLKDGELSILLISPEALISGETSNGFGGLFKSLPPIAFVCIDEAHCVSQWSHNFRPSYLMICRVLREKLKVKTILGLTATASQATIKSVINHINIPDGFSGVISNPDLPNNLMLTVSQEIDKDRSLITLLSSEAISAYDSIIVYCIRRDECERIAGVIRSSLQEPGKRVMENRGRKRKLISFVAEAYHAGMSAAQRKRIQSNFMNGTVRIIVATVAFGMGINKSNIRCIIHYDMPSSFESYVQEVGRAGRDGKDAHCHVFINNNRKDKNELLKHIYANSIDRHVIRKLLRKVFVPCECRKHQATLENGFVKCKGHEVGIPIDSTVEELDLAAENITTLLCYLELHPDKVIKVLHNTYTVCKIFSYAGLERLKQAASSCPPLAMALQCINKYGNKRENSNILEFPVVDVASEMGWESGIVKYKLKNLEWIFENGANKRSPFKVEFHTLGFRIRAPGDFTPSELDKMLDYLHETVISQEKAKLHQLEEVTMALHNLGTKPVHALISGTEDDLTEKSNELKAIISTYFQRQNNVDLEIELEARPLNEDHIISDVRALISSYRDCKFTGRSIARIFQGISSPNYPALVWGRCKFWRSHMNEDFNGIVRLATEQLLELSLK